jgi:hypothetical protein
MIVPVFLSTFMRRVAIEGSKLLYLLSDYQ